MSNGIRHSVWTDEEPEYAPFLKIARNTYYQWVPSKKYTSAGYSIKCKSLVGRVGDGRDLERAAMCRELTREMLNWYEGIEGQQSASEVHNWSWLAAKYLTDKYSPYWEVGADTRMKYRREINNTILPAIGEIEIAETDYQEMMVWKQLMEQNNRSLSYIQQFFAHFCMIARYGVLIGVDGCERVATIRSNMKIRSAPPRSVAIDRQSCMAIVDYFLSKGQDYMALAVLLRFEFGWRGVDAYGKWEPAEGRKGGVCRNGRIWTSGVTWDMVSEDLTTVTKVYNKTKNTLSEPYTLNLVPKMREILMKVPYENRFGPLVVCSNGLPPSDQTVRLAFRTAVLELGLPKEFQIRDLRAGGITEAMDLVDNNIQARDFAGHTQAKTTDMYMRGRSKTANRVIELRQKKALGDK